MKADRGVKGALRDGRGESRTRRVDARRPACPSGLRVAGRHFRWDWQHECGWKRRGDDSSDGRRPLGRDGGPRSRRRGSSSRRCRARSRE
jgi:hypothetical protein